MSFFSATPPSSYKAQIRVEGFQLPSPGTPPPGSNNNSGGSNGNNGGGNMNDLFSHTFLPDAFRKFPPPPGMGDAGGGGHDFNDDLVSLIGDRSSNSQQGGGGAGNGNGNGSGVGTGGYDDGYHRTTHNIFDVSSPIPVNNNGGANGAGGNGPGSQPSSVHSPSTSLHDYHQHHHPAHFNSTLPALNSSMRYEPPPENNPLTPSSPQQPSHPPPSSYHPHNSFARHTPSPIHSQHAPVPVNGRSRSRSRPPSSGATAPNPSTMSSLNNGGVGPARTTRTRRNNSVSGTSPPPLQHGRPHAILIPGGGGAQRNSHGGLVGGPMSAGAAAPGGGNPWFMAQGQGQNSTDYALPTPESLNSQNLHSSISHSSAHHQHSHSHSGYGPFSLSPPPPSTNPDISHHLPPLHHMAHSLPKSPMEQHLPHPHHQHHLSSSGLSKSPMEHPSYPPSYGFPGNVNGPSTGGGSPDDSPGSLPTSLGGGLGGGTAGLTAPGVTSTGSAGYGMGNMGMNIGMPAGMGGMPSQHGVGSAPGPGVQQSQSIGVSGPGNVTGATSNGQTGDKQSLLANEKRRRRRESHNAVERRRRDNINEKITELATLIPECMLDGTTAPNAKDTGSGTTPPLTEDALVPKGGSDGGLKQEKDDGDTIPAPGGSLSDNGAVVKANKGMILRKSVEYIRYLQQLVTAQGARNRELEHELKKFRGSSVSSIGSSSPSNNGVGDGGVSSSDKNSGIDHMQDALSLVDDDDDDGQEVDDRMSMGIGGGDVDSEGMVLHDEFVSSPTLSGGPNSNQNATAGGGPSVIKGSLNRKIQHKHSSSNSIPKPPRLPSMPEEDMEVDKMSNIGGDIQDLGDFGGGSLSPESGSHESAGGLGNGVGDNDDDLERGRTRGVRVGVQGMGNGGMGMKPDNNMMDDGIGDDHGMGGMDPMGFGMLNGHHQMHAQQQQQQQQVMW